MVQRRRLYGGIGILLAATIGWMALNSYYTATSNKLTENLKKHIIPIATTKAESGFEDLEPLREILKDKKIVAMGEATHGTKEFFEMKHRMFEFLVEELDYRVFAIEASFGGGQVVNEYINGEGTIEEAVRALGYWTWATKEVALMLEWMKEFNDNLMEERKIKFYGFDIQDIQDSHRYVLEYLQEVDGEKYDEMKIRLYNFGSALANNIQPGWEGTHRFRETAEIIDSLLKNKENQYISRSSETLYTTILQHMVVINQWIDLKETKGADKSRLRDTYMAENVGWIIEHEKRLGNKEIMLWAHNGHIEKKGAIERMGNHLSKIYQDAYYAIAFDFYKGSFRAIPGVGFASYSEDMTMDFSIKDSPTKSLVHHLNNTEVPMSMLDFKNAMGDEGLARFLTSRSKMHYIGSIYFGRHIKPLYIANLVLTDSFDALIYVKNTTAAEGTLYNQAFELNRDGDKLLISYYRIYLLIVAIVVIIIGLIIFNILKRRRGVTLVKSEKDEEKNFDTVDKVDKNKSFIELNKYLMGLSATKLALLAIAASSIVCLVSFPFNSIAKQNTNLDVVIIFSNITSAFIATFIFNLLPLKLLGWMTKDKKNRLWHILAASLLVAVFSLYSSNWVMAAVNLMVGLLLNYTYVIYELREKSPYIMVSLIRLASNIVLMLFIEFMT